jgi:peptide/nickel transport system substrate-binding protein
MKRLRWPVIVGVLALVAAACSPTDTETTTTTGPTGTTEPGATTTTVEPGTPFQGLTLDSGGCGADLGYLDAEGNPAVYGGKVNTITALDEFTVEFNLCSPDPAFLAKLAFSVFGIQPSEYLQATGGGGDILDAPVGTGPYSLKEWVRGDSVVFEAFSDYYGQVAPQQTFVLRWATESAGRLLELQAGTVDGITFPGTEDLATIEGDPNLTLLPKPEPNIFYVGFTNTFAPYDDVNVRKAIAMGIDRQRIVDTFYAPGSEAASHFTPCSVEFGCEGDSWYDFDVDAAKALLAETDVPDGFSTKIFYRDVTRGYLPTPGDVAVDIADQLKTNLNIDAEVVVMESGEFIQASTAGALDGIHLLGWTGDYPHITNFLDFHFNADNPQFGVNDASYADPLAAASSLVDPAQLAPLYAEANNAIKEFVPMVAIAHGGAYYAASANVQGSYAPPWGDVTFNLWDNGGDTMVFMQGNEPISLYCADESDGESLRACAQIVEGLYSYSPDGAAQPQLATGCEPNDDLSVWTCSLREGVLFHDGSSFDANDVVVSFTAGLDAASPLHVGNSGAFDYYSYLWDSLIRPPEPEPEG